MDIRKMQEGDLAAVTRLYREANPFARANDIRTWTAKSLERFPELHIVAREEPNLVAALSATLEHRRTLHIEDIAVSRSMRGAGIGSGLMREILRLGKKAGARKATLWVHWKNAPAIPFYYRHGFAIRGTSQTNSIPFVPDGEDVIWMEQSL